MSTIRRRAAVLVLLAAATAGAAGCDAFAWILVKTVGPWVPEETRQAEYDLKGQSLLVLVDVKDPALVSEFPRLELALADALTEALQKAKACGPVVPARQLDAARRAEPTFANWSVAQVGKYFNVDLVMHVEVTDCRLRDNPGSNVYHGYMEAAVHVVSPEAGKQVWPVLSAARIVVAETQPDVEAEQRIEQESILIDGFADKVARLFYTFKLEDLPMRPKVR